jgi:Fic family protein
LDGSLYTYKETVSAVKFGGYVDQKSAESGKNAVKCYNSLLYVLSKFVGYKYLTIQDLLSIHRSLYEDSAWFRRADVSCGDHNYPAWPKVLELIGNAVEVYNRDEGNLISKIAKFHYEYMNIHPFVEYSNTVGRILIALELIRNGFLPVSIPAKSRLNYNTYISSGCKDGVRRLEDLIYELEFKELSAYNKYVLWETW